MHDRHLSKRRRLTSAAAVALAGVLLLAGCIVETSSIATGDNSSGGTSQAGNGAGNPSDVVPTPTVGAVEFLPTPTAVPAATATPIPEPTPLPEPTATPEPVGPASPTPLPVIIPEADLEPTLVEAGQIVIPVGGETSFVLASSRPILQLPGHTLIYVDEARQAEVDLFTPVATGEGVELADYDAVIAAIEADPGLEAVDELNAVSIAGLPTRVFEGSSVTGTRSFYTDLETLGNDSAGWYPPTRIRMWVIDAPAGALVVSAESLVDPGQYSDAVRLATEILTTITFS